MSDDVKLPTLAEFAERIRQKRGDKKTPNTPRKRRGKRDRSRLLEIGPVQDLQFEEPQPQWQMGEVQMAEPRPRVDVQIGEVQMGEKGPLTIKADRIRRMVAEGKMDPRMGQRMLLRLVRSQ